ncbi:MAG: EboA domain-containing protein [Polyangiaceae bacterium]|nr:EboA domain-containing protein [Polyangiaceae bacterium]
MPLKIALIRELAGPAKQWLADVLEGTSLDDLAAHFSSVASSVRDPSWTVSDEGREFLIANDLAWLLRGSSLEELARVLVFIRALEVASDRRALAETWYLDAARSGRRAILRALALAPRPKLHLDLAVLAAVSTEPSVFDAICFENPYPARFFDDACFDHMVGRATERRGSLERVLGLEGRRNEQLVRRAVETALRTADELKPSAD